MNPESNEQRQSESSKDARLAEYNSLREEIGRNSQLTANVFLANVTATGVLFGFGFDTGKGAIFLSPFAILIPSLFFITSQLESTTCIASYIKMVLEPGLGLSWESDWWEIRQRGLLPRRRKYTLAVSGLYGALNVSCVFLAVLHWDATALWQLALIVVPLAILTGLGILGFIEAFSPSLIKDYELAWSRLDVAKEETARHHTDEQ